VAFEDGDVSRPVVLGAVWQGPTRPESPSHDGHPRVLRTRSGSRLVLDDSAGTAGVRTASGHEVVLDDTTEQVTVAHASGCRVTLSATSVTIQASVSVDVIAPTVTVDASLARFSGVLQADTVVATTAVVSPSYSPGAGNLL
jgi:phage baseplate assembly protein gpV